MRSTLGRRHLCSPDELHRSLVGNTRVARDNSAHSVDRAISILQVVARHGAAGVTESAAELGVTSIGKSSGDISA